MNVIYRFVAFIGKIQLVIMFIGICLPLLAGLWGLLIVIAS